MSDPRLVKLTGRRSRQPLRSAAAEIRGLSKEGKAYELSDGAVRAAGLAHQRGHYREPTAAYSAVSSGTQQALNG